VARSLLSLSGIYTDRSDARAEQFARRALEIFEKAYGPQHPLVGDALLALAIFYGDRQDFATAEPLYQRALIINEKAYGAESPQVSALLSNFALLYKNKGDYPRAEAMAQRALSNYEKEYGQENFHFANLLSQLAVMYRDDGDFVRAEEMLQRAIAIQEKKLGPESRDVAMSLDSLAVLYRMKGEYTKAEPLLQRALTISEKASGPESNDATLIVFNLAGVLRDKGDYPRAEQLYTRSLAIAEKMYGTAHHNLGAILGSLASLYVAQGDKAQALAAQTRANDIAEHNLSAALTTGSENQKRLYLATLSSQTDMTLTLNTALAPDSIEARRLALTTILRRKGRALDAMSNQVESLRRRLDPQDRPLLDQLSATRAQLSALTLKGANRISQAQYRAEVARLEAEAERLEAQVGARSAEFRVETEPVTLAGVQAALPAGAALVEIVSYRPYNPAGKTFKDRFGAPRYVAYVLKPQGEPSFVDLGEAASIDREVSQLRVALSSPGSKDVKQLARALDERVMRPVRALLGGVRHVLISPDGALNLLPFGALVDEQNRYLIETYLISYLTSGRDLLRLRAARESRETPLVIANPLFNDVSAESGVSSSSRGAENLRAPDFSEMKFISLPGTGGEARALATILPGARVLTGGQATEAALKQARGPSVLHIATHGFFMPDLAATPGEARRGLPGDVASPDAERVVAAANAPGESLLLRSGLILAGANNLHSVGGEDGVLTALEASGLDLWGTKLVVLSACNTGVGSVRNSDGVYGLRRALVLAGSESQVMSLWQVSDTATRDLMTAYYGRLAAGGGRAEALREVQLGMLRSRLLSHPFFWSSFIQSGEWKAMSLPKAGAQ
jgi:CHAT domain-containing protein